MDLCLQSDVSAFFFFFAHCAIAHCTFILQKILSADCLWLVCRKKTINSCRFNSMSLLFNTLSRFVIAFLPRSKCFLLLHNKLYKLRCLNQHPFLSSGFYKPKVQHGLVGLSYKRSYTAEVKARSYKVGCFFLDTLGKSLHPGSLRL